MRNTSNGRKAAQGFTLIELLIVIAIIGILAAVLIPNLLSARTRAFDTAAQACASGIATASEVVMIDTQTYGTTAVDTSGIGACDNVTVTGSGAGDTYAYTTSHANSDAVFAITPGSGVQRNP